MLRSEEYGRIWRPGKLRMRPGGNREQLIEVWLKVNPSSELNLPRRRSRGQRADSAKASSSVSHTRCVVVLDIEDIEEFRPELEAKFLMDGYVFN